MLRQTWFAGLLAASTLWAALAAGAEPAGKAGARAGAAPLRFWTDTSGTYKVRASLVDLEDGNVRLKKADGTIVSVPLEKLSPADQKWAGEHATAAGGDWPGWRGPNRDGKSPDKGLLKQWPEKRPALLWKATGLGNGYSSVTVSGGTVYVTARWASI